MERTTRKLMALAALRFQVDEARLSPNDDFFDTLGIDSIQALELLSAVEAAFNVELPDYELQGVKTFSALAERIERRL